ncbi:MAG: hypothetical protein GF350_15485 [Chitinivibrionales bacterium]|nr:hypothetical protein [Chitinivibrionales bacterium]
MAKKILIPVLASAVLFCAVAHFMSVVWPQKSLEEKEIGSSDAPARVLIIGVTSDFKQAVIDRVTGVIKSDSLFIRIAGIKEIDKTEPPEWDAILLVNTCMGWDYDNRVKKLVQKNNDYDHFILFTSSGDPDACTKKKKLPGEIDAVSSASVEEKISVVTDTLAAFITKHLGASK